MHWSTVRNGVLDDFVFQRGDAQRPLSAVGFEVSRLSRRLSPVGSPVNAALKVSDLLSPKFLLVVPPSHSINTDR